MLLMKDKLLLDFHCHYF